MCPTTPPPSPGFERQARSGAGSLCDLTTAAGRGPSLAAGPPAAVSHWLRRTALPGHKARVPRRGRAAQGKEGRRGSLRPGQLRAEIYRASCLCGIRHRRPQESELWSLVFSGRQSRPPQSLSGWSPEAADWRPLGRSGTGKAGALPAQWHRCLGYHFIPSQYSSNNRWFSLSKGFLKNNTISTSNSLEPPITKAFAVLVM